MDQRKIFIIDQYKNKERVLSKSEIKSLQSSGRNSNFEVFLFTLKSPAGSCGDEIDFLVWKEGKKIRKINFSNENCCIITGSAANIASSYLENSLFSQKSLESLVFNIEKMIKGETYNKSKIGDFNYFSGIENLYGRSECIKVITNFMKKVIS